MKFVSIPLLLLCSVFLQGHSTESPTLKETLEYLDKRAAEVKGMNVSFTSGQLFDLYSASWWKTLYDGHAITYYTLTQSNRWADPAYCEKIKSRGISHVYSYSFKFKPSQITSVVDATTISPTSPVGMITVSFAAKTVTLTGDFERAADKGCYTVKDPRQVYPVSSFYVPYLKADPTAFKRIKKAILHLKNLTTEDDPFAD